jgi:hypothetical protein
MEGKTYLEILAENDEEARQEFDPNAKDLLVSGHTEYEHSVGGDDHHPDELEDQDEFKKPQGSHQLASYVPNPITHEDKTKLSVRYDKDVFTQVVNIDSRFRTNPSDTSSNFLFKLKTPIKNVVSVRISSIELPNTFYNFSFRRGNTTIGVRSPSGTGNFYSLVIADGNYDAAGLCAVVQAQLRTIVFDNNLSLPNAAVTFSITTGLTTISTAPNLLGAPTIEFNFQYGIFSNRPFNSSLGYSLGFHKTFVSPEPNPYSGSSRYTGEAILDTTDCHYVFLSLDPDWKVVVHSTYDTTQLFSFAKIVMNVPKFGVLYDNGANTLTKEYHLKQPSNIISIPVRLSDPYDQDLDLVGTEFSFSLEVKECLNAALYESMRN